MGILLPTASGKGGVGKSLVAVNLAIAMAARGKTVVLVDLDLGGANLHTLMGIKNRHAGLGSLIHRRESSVEALVIETEIPRLFFIPGDALLPGTANLEFFTKRKILKGLEALPADYVIMDLGAGSSWNTVDFFLSSASGLIVTVPEVTAILNAYSFLKTSLFRALFRAFPAKSEERTLIAEFVAQKIEGTNESFAQLKTRLLERFPDRAPEAFTRIGVLWPRVIINMGRGNHDLATGSRLREISARNLGMDMAYIGFLPRDENVPRSVIERVPLVLSRPQNPFSQGIQRVADRILESPTPLVPVLYEDNEDLNALAVQEEEGNSY